MTDFDVLVIGNGMIGSAASRYLSASGEHRVGVLGSGEPTDYARHEGVFASHYDQGRITRQLSPDLYWGALGAASIEQYGLIERESGIQFWFPVGGLTVTRERAETRKQGQIAWERGIRTRMLDGSSLARFQPAYAFPDDYHAIYEPAPAGYINPRDLIRAQSVIAQRQGAVFVEGVATSVTRETNLPVASGGAGYVVRLLGGESISAEKILLTTGAFTNCYDLLPQPLPLRIKNEFTILGEVSAETARQLRDLPFINYAIEHPDISDIYQLPPILYPNGRYYVKMGANTRADRTLTTLAEMRDWMSGGDTSAMEPVMRAAVQTVMPTTEFLSWEMKRCLVTYTPTRRPIIDQVAAGLFVAVGGNGLGAHSSDAIGKIAASNI